MFIEKGGIEYVMIDGKEVPVVKCEAEVVVRNKKTNQEYASDEEAQNDINNPDTDTVAGDVTRSVKIKVAKMPMIGTASDKDEE
jgi:hypothetical protein|tara:strand:+ start:244 stop:495 length:252 start_codon:yes stop_codon:yes gene_type:complete